jgi:hypothetical protein
LILAYYIDVDICAAAFLHKSNFTGASTWSKA